VSGRHSPDHARLRALLEDWRSALRRELPAAVELRHHLHSHPDLSGAEGPTATRVAR
jgi:metal-dependent amidase/aminoacylase/carboxypeptidase family protein